MEARGSPLQKFRQIEIHTNRPVSESPGGGSLQAPVQLVGIPPPVPDGNHLYLLMRLVDDKVDGVRPAQHPRLAAVASDFGKAQRLGGNRRHHLVHRLHETNSEAFDLLLRPSRLSVIGSVPLLQFL